MSTFLHFLSLAPLLEELTLNNTIPIFDVTLPDEDQRSDPASNSALLPTPPVKLTRLKAINWTFPLPGDVHQLMSFIDCPALEKLDVWVEAPNPKEEGPWRGHDLSYGTRMKLPMVIDCSPVRDLSFQFSTDDSTVSSLRKLSFPSLESLELMSVDRGTEKDDKTSSRSPTMFPRIESIFHDPRLFCLTNLTLSHFQFNKDHQRPEAILGYIPALISLSLESCLGVENLIKVLEERCTLNLPTMNGVSRAGRVGGVKVCPRLEALSFWGCDDLAIGLLLKIVLTRNGDVSGRNSEPENPSKRIHGGDPHAELGPIGTITGSEHGGKGLNLGASSVAEPALSTASPRKIKPLRKSVHQASASGGRAGSCEVGAGAGRRPSLEAARLVAHEVSQPSPILYIRIHQCPLIHLGDALSLQDLGVTDIVCDGNE
ncbi:hypothetical protein EST38_g2315 [Candolleomyces aberdarensis]|uniref:F-box protein n=1 Tax=Candolleomyces aberdarensis TaxID=2316362 RepID=A0A4Q2DUY2_9AGAR|nr:hypothetical protein EST38_g2315 [Candolleomyces aberdarensis]